MNYKVFLGLMIVGCGNDFDNPHPPKGSSDCGPSLSLVARVIDGDTVVLTNEEKVRYLLVNTPEKGECYYEEATNFNKNYVLGKMISLTYDEQCKDKYGRWLAYVETENGEINTLLLTNGMAKLLHISPDGDDRLDEFKRYEEYAKENKLGIWGVCE